MDRHDLYELCVQSPPDAVRLLREAHGGEPRVLGEDFCGTAAVARAWVSSVPGGRAVGVDHDPEVLARAAALAPPGLTLIRGDVRTATDPADPAHRCDVLFVGNFSIGELHDRPALVAYLCRCRERLTPGGVAVIDTYGGETAFRTGTLGRLRIGPRGEIVRSIWEQREADPLTARVVNALHFRIEEDGEITQELFDAFVYRWRLWSAPELRDAMTEAGFAGTEAIGGLAGASHEAPPPGPGVCVVGRTPPA